MTLLLFWIEETWRDQLVHFWQQILKLLKDLATSQCEFEPIPGPNQEIILKHCACSLQCSAYGRLAEK